MSEVSYTSETDIGKLNEFIYDQGAITTSGLVEERDQDRIYLKKKLRELRDLGKVEKLEAEEYKDPIWHKEFNEIPSVIKNMVNSE